MTRIRDGVVRSVGASRAEAFGGALAWARAWALGWGLGGALGCTLGLWLGGDAPARAQSRPWTDITGRTIEAELIRVELGGVRLKVKITGGTREYVVPFEKLSALDQDYLLARQGERGVSGATVKSADRPQDRWALLVGVNEYRNFSGLGSCGRDVRQLRQRLLNLGYADSHVIVLHDEAETPDRKPSKANIELWLDRLLTGRVEATATKNIRVQPRLAGPADQILVAFSGHGVQLDGVSYFCPGEADLADPATTMISMTRVYQRLADVSRGLRLLLVDACRNTPGGDGPAAKNLKAFEVDSRMLSRGVVALSSCSSGQTSLEADALRQGVFSYFLQGALGGAAGTPNADGLVEVRLNQALAFTIDRTSAYADNLLKREQTPHFEGSIEGNPLLGLVRADQAVKAEQLASTRPKASGSECERYQLRLFEVKTPALPAGWEGPGGLVSAEHEGRRVLKSNADRPQKLVSKPLAIRGDFYLELELDHGHETYDVVLKGAQGGRDLAFKLRFAGSWWYFTMPDNQEKWFEQLGATERVATSRLRLERQGKQYRLMVNSDLNKEFAYSYEDYRDFEGIDITFDGSSGKLYDLRLGPLEENVDRTGATAEYLPVIPNGRLPDGWQALGQPANGQMRLVSSLDKVDVRGDFYLQILAQGKDGPAYTLTLLGREGDRPLPITFNHNGPYLYVAFPMLKEDWYEVRDPEKGFTVRLERRDGAFQLIVNNQPVKHSLRGGGFGDFQGLQVDIWSPTFSIGKLAVGPLK